MDPVYMFGLASQHARWATVRQAVIAGNIANASTPGYAALDIEPFSAVLDDMAITMARSDPRHIDTGGSGSAAAASWAVEDTGGPVALDQELIKAGEVNRAFALDTSVVRAFHRMLLASVRGA